MADPKLIWDFNEGSIREWIYNHSRFLMRKHIVEQLEKIRFVQAKACIDNGSCLSCGCRTPGVLFCTKGCSLEKHDSETRMALAGKENPCYPRMMSRKDWQAYKIQNNEKLQRLHEQN